MTSIRGVVSRSPLSRIVWPIVPALVFLVALFVLPLLGSVASSFFPFDRATGANQSTITLANYTDFFADAQNRSILLGTIRICIITTLIALLIGYPTAYYISLKRGRARTYLILAVVMPLLILTVVRTLGWLLIFSSSGPVNSVLLSLGLIHEPLRLLYTEPIVVIGMVHVLLPFMVLSILAALGRIDPAVLRAAQSLGASPRQRIWRVVVPLSLPGVVAGSLLVFTLCASAFLTPAVLGGSRVEMVSYLMYVQVYSLSNWSLASAISVLLLTVVGLVVLVYLRVVENRRYRAIFR